MGKVSAWWDDLDDTGQNWVVISGFAMLAVVGITVGVVAATSGLAVMEPLIHLGLGFGVGSLMAGLFTTMARLM
jgi:hypothetical protein